MKFWLGILVTNLKSIIYRERPEFRRQAKWSWEQARVREYDL